MTRSVAARSFTASGAWMRHAYHDPHDSKATRPPGRPCATYFSVPSPTSRRCCEGHASVALRASQLAGRRAAQPARSRRPAPVGGHRGWEPRDLAAKSPVSKSSRNRADLGTIVGKALEKQIERRYGSAAALGEDVERYLTSQPILARPPSTAYQMRKFAARNRAFVAAAAATLVVLVAGAVVSTTFGLRAAAQRRVAESARADLEVVSEFQSRMLSRVDPATMGADMLADLRQRVVATARADGREDTKASAAGAAFDQLVRGVNTTDAALHVIDRQILAPALDTAAGEFEDRPEIGLELRSTIGDTYGELGMLTQAESVGRAVYEDAGRRFGADDPRTLEAGRRLAQELSFLGRDDDARALFEEVIRIHDTAWGPDHPWSAGNLDDYAKLLRLTGETSRAAELEARARAARARPGTPDRTP